MKIYRKYILLSAAI